MAPQGFLQVPASLWDPPIAVFLHRQGNLGTGNTTQGAQLQGTSRLRRLGGPAPAAATPSTQFSASGQSRLTSKDTRRSGSQLPPLQTSWPPGCAALGPRSSSRWPDPRPAELAGHSPCPEGGGEEPVSMVATPDATQSGQKTGAPPGPLAPLTEDRPPPLSHEHLVVHLPSHSNSFPESSEVSLAQDQ